MAFLAIVLDSAPDGKEGTAFVRKKLTMGCMWGMAAVLAVLLTLLTREELFVLNGEAEFQKTEMAENGMLETSFAPAFDEIRGINLGLECAGENGQYDITLWEGDVPKYQDTIFIKDCNDNFQYMDVSWKLDSHKAYRLTVQIHDNDEPVYVWVTEQGEMPLREYGNLVIEGAAVNGQYLAGITYWCLPVSKKTLLFIFLTWLGIGGVVAYTFLSEKLANFRILERKDDAKTEKTY